MCVDLSSDLLDYVCQSQKQRDTNAKQNKEPKFIFSSAVHDF